MRHEPDSPAVEHKPVAGEPTRAPRLAWYGVFLFGGLAGGAGFSDLVTFTGLAFAIPFAVAVIFRVQRIQLTAFSSACLLAGLFGGETLWHWAQGRLARWLSDLPILLLGYAFIAAFCCLFAIALASALRPAARRVA